MSIETGEHDSFHRRAGHDKSLRSQGDAGLGSTEGYGRIAQVTPYVNQLSRYRPCIEYFGVPYDQAIPLDDGTMGSHSFIQEARLRTVEQTMGQVGYLVFTLDRTGARNAWALTRASEEHPNAEPPDVNSDNGLLLDRVLRVNGDGRYTTPKGFFHIPHGSGKGTGTYNISDRIHAFFMQEGAFIFTSAEEQGFKYVVGMEDVKQRQRIENMIAGGNYERKQEPVEGSKEFRDVLIGIIPKDLPGEGEEVRAELQPLSRNRVVLKPGTCYRTTSGLEHALGVSCISSDRTRTPSIDPVGWIALFDDKGERCVLVDQNETIRLLGMEYMRRHGYLPLPSEEQAELNHIGLGPTIEPIKGLGHNQAPHELIDPSGAGFANKSNTWATMYDIMRELTTFGYDPGRTHLSAMVKIRDSLNRNKEHVNAVLIGNVVSQMIEALYPAIPQEHLDIQANLLPDERTRRLYSMIIEKVSDAEEAAGIWYKIAEYLKLEDGKGAPIIREGGILIPPEINERSASILLSVGIIAIEQLIVQCIVPGSTRYGPDSIYGKSLQDIGDAIGNPGFLEHVQNLARRVEEGNGKFGRQRGECEELVNALRISMDLPTIIDIIKGDNYDRFRDDRKAQEALILMRKVGAILHQSPLASVAFKKRGGLNAGIDLIIEQYCPQNLP